MDVTIYRQLVGSFMYRVNTRLDICYAINQLIQAMFRPTKLFWRASKHVLSYLRGTTQFGLWYRRTEGVKLCGFTDADWVESPSDRKSTSGGILRPVISCYTRKKIFVELIPVEVEYMVVSQAACEVIWMRNILVGIFGQMMDPTMIYCD